MKKLLPLILSAVVSVSAQSLPPRTPPEIVGDANSFGFHLVAQVASKQDKTENIVLAPVGVRIGFAQLREFASIKAAKELDAVIGNRLSAIPERTGFHNLLSGWEVLSEIAGFFVVATALWYGLGEAFHEFRRRRIGSERDAKTVGLWTSVLAFLITISPIISVAILFLEKKGYQITSNGDILNHAGGVSVSGIASYLLGFIEGAVFVFGPVFPFLGLPPALLNTIRRNVRWPYRLIPWVMIAMSAGAYVAFYNLSGMAHGF